MLSIIVPTYNEADNLSALVQRLDSALSDVDYELIISDDNSSDGTLKVCDTLAMSYPLTLIQPSGRPRDLSISVIDGIKAAKNTRVLVMDADLSHPSEMLPLMLAKLDECPSSFVIGSRYVDGGGFDRDWSIWRFINSYLATAIARPLVNCTDPMSGFFLFDKSCIDIQNLNPIGYKIGLEIMVRGDFKSIEELPIQFKDRKIGESKMNFDQQLKYLRHLRRLYLFKFGNFAEFVHFSAVGASGFLVDITFYYVLQLFGMPHLLARALSFFPATSWNWALNRVTTFGDRARRPKARQWLEFISIATLGFIINYSVYAALTSYTLFFDQYRILALITGVASASLFNFLSSSMFIYSDKRA